MFNLSASASHKSLLLGGASFAAMLLMAPMAHATTFTGMTGQSVSSVPNTVATKPVTSGAGPNSPNLQPGAQSQSSTDFSSALARIQAQLSSQAAARSAAQAGPNNLGTAAHPLVDVVDGLGPNGLNPVANPKPAAQDSTGLVTWDGASAPTQTNDASGNANVTIHQTQSRAILSWQSFNVGKKTTVNFDQQGNADWVALNRVVGADTAPSQILGNIKADGTVLVINQNGIIFGGSSQVNVNSLIASALDVGRVVDQSGTNAAAWSVQTIGQRNQEFLVDGLLGYADANNNGQVVSPVNPTFSPTSATKTPSNGFIYAPVTGRIDIEDGAQIASSDGGYILLAGPAIENAGSLKSNQGQVILAAGDQVSLVRATGAVGTPVPDVRGFIPVVTNLQSGATESVVNDTGGIIQASEGSIILDSPASGGAAVNNGVLSATTSISRNGVIEVGGASIEIAPNSTIAITPDQGDGTIPQDPVSIADFKPSRVLIGNIDSQISPPVNYAALIDIGANSLIFAPSGNIAIGATSGANLYTGTSATSRVFVDSGAIIDAAGLTDIDIPVTRNAIKISPLKDNELADDPAYKDSFLNGATVYVDPRLSGVRDDGVAWIGSPLIDAASYAEQVGVSVSELMTKGGNVVLGAKSYNGAGNAADAPDVIVKSGAAINVAGGWVTYQPGTIQTTKLITADGRVVDIGNANPDEDYVGIYNGYVVSHPRWAVNDTYTTPLIFGAYYAPEYSEGRDAGSLTLQASAINFAGAVDAGVYSGPLQVVEALPGTAASAIFGDNRTLQAAPSQLPTGGFFFVQAEGVDGNTLTQEPPLNTGGADILVTKASDYQALPESLGYGQSIQVAADGTVTVPVRAPLSILTTAQLGTIDLSDALLSGSGFADISLATSGSVTVAKGANIALAAGGAFDVLAGRKIAIDGSVSVPSGEISLATFDSRAISAGGSVFSTTAAQAGDFDVVVNGTLSAAGRWVNDSGLGAGDIEGAAWLHGGTITLYAAPRVSSLNNSPSSDGWVSPGTAGAPATATDLSGSILINPGSMIDVSGGGRVDRLGHLDLSATGGNLNLFDETSYYQVAGSSNFGYEGSLSGFRINGLVFGGIGGNVPYVPVNPDTINAHVLIDPNAIRAQGFAGGGTFTLVSPDFAFGSNDGVASTELPLDFISSAGFANYNITSYKTDLIANPFTNGLGGTDAILATQVLTIGAGQTLNLSQSLLPSVLSGTQTTALRGLASGGNLFDILTPGIPADDWDRKPVNLALGGLLELDISQGGRVIGDAGAQLTVSQLLNEGTIYLPGGTLKQHMVVPVLYAQNGALAVHSLSDAFGMNSDGSIDENAASKISGLTNAQLASNWSIYRLGNLDADQGLVLAPGAVTDLSGVSVRDPYATNGPNGSLIATGRLVDGGTLETSPSAAMTGRNIYQAGVNSPYSWLATITSSGNGIKTTPLAVTQVGLELIAAPGTTINLSGASDEYDEPIANKGILIGGSGYAATPVWSDAGMLSAGAGATLTGAVIAARGGAAQAEGGELVLLDPILAQHDPAMPAANTVSADMISAAGFTTLVALGSVSSQGDVTLNLDREFSLEDRPVINDGRAIDPDSTVLTIRSGGGVLTINAPYISFDSNFDTISSPIHGTTGTGTDIFNAGNIDVAGALLIDQSVADAAFNATGDMRLTGVVPWQQTYYPASATPVQTLNGMIAANGNLSFTAGQIYPTTGSSFAITSAAADGVITFGRTGNAPAAPYSADGNLLVQASKIVQGGVIRVPLGTLTLGGSTSTSFAPATDSVEMTDGSITSVSANGLIIPYGTTTDQTEWYFTPTSTDPLTAPPQKLLSMNGGNIAIDSGADIDISGGGDLYAYEFVPGTGGSRDLLNQLNPDTFTGNNGYQYPDGRQVYAIVPGLSDAPVAAFDPVYSANYAALSTPQQSGLRVWLNSGKGLTASWYTLLPAQYALLPGGMRVVEETGVTNAATGTSIREPDSSLIVSGYYGNANSGSAQSQVRLFNVQSQAVIAKESNDVTTTANSYFANSAQQNGTVTPQLPIDAGRLVLNPVATLTVNSVLSTAAADKGRGAQVDIGAAAIDILSSLPDTDPNDGTVRVTAASLTNLNANSLLIGGTRTDNADGTTTLNVSANSIDVSNDSSAPLSAGEIVLVANGGITVADGSAIIATGALSDTRTGAYEIGADSTFGSGALLRVANGPERLVNRDNIGSPASLTMGAATLSGNAVMFDSSDAESIDPATIIKDAKFVALGAPRIGFGADPATYDGLVVTGDLERLLTQSGAQLTLRSQSSIDFAGGDYTFGEIRLDAAALSDLDGGDVAIQGNTVSLGNSGAAGVVCSDCTTGGGKLTISADTILFTGGDIATKSSILAGSVPVTLSTAATFVLPAGTLLANGIQILTEPALVTVPEGATLNIAGGTGLVLPAGADGSLNAGTDASFGKGQVTVVAGSYFFPNGYKANFISGAAGGTFAAGTYSVTNDVPVALPSGTEATLAADAVLSTTNFFSGGVTLAASGGVLSQGKGSVLDVGGAPLQIHTPYIGDQMQALPIGTNATVPDLTLASLGAVAIDNVGDGALSSIAGVPGGAVTIQGQSVSVSGTDIRGTAGKVAILAAYGITLTDGAIIEAPGYTKTFGDSVDSTTQNAPGGNVILSAANGDIDLGNATLSVSGGAGNAGTLTLSAPKGTVDLASATLNGAPGTGGMGGAFVLDSLGAVDLAALNAKVGADGFTGGFSVATSSGDLILAAGQTLNAGYVSLTADGGNVDIAGSIDTAGISGGDVSLYGRNGVTLESTANINASASGYAGSDTRQAKGGNVTLGTDFINATTNGDGSISGTSGTITIANGAVINVAAQRPGDRLVPYVADNVEYYDYVQGDQSGTVTLRAPVVPFSGGDTVNVSVANAGSIQGASAVNLIGFKRWDLGAVASSGLYSGVTLNGGTVTLDVTAGLDTPNMDGSMTVVPGINFLGDVGAPGASTLVDFVQNYDVSAAYGNLGGLASQSNFHAQPGMDLTYAGNITLASNWNLGAGVVNQSRAIADGLMVMDAALGKPVLNVPTGSTEAQAEAALLDPAYTQMTYRVGGSIYGEPGVLSLRAGGNLDLHGSVTDGFFQFRDQTDPTYLAQVGATNNAVILTGDAGCQFPFFCSTTDFATIPDWNTINWATFDGTQPIFYQGISFFDVGYTASVATDGVTRAPFSALANTPAALGSFPVGTGAGTSSIPNGGDPIGSAEVFPLLTQRDGTSRAVSSWSYVFAAGADFTGPSPMPSTDPQRTDPSSRANFIVEGTTSYSYARDAGGAVVTGGLAIDTNTGASANLFVSPTDSSLSVADWLSQFSTLYSGLSDDAAAGFFFGLGVNGDSPVVDLIYGPQGNPTPSASSLLGQFIAANGLQLGTGTRNPVTGIYNGYSFGDVYAEGGGNTTLYMPVYWLKQFYQQFLVPNASALQAAFPCNVCTPGTPGTPVTTYTKSLVRTGTGSINVAASGNVDLTNGPATGRQIYLNGSFDGPNTYQVGGTSIYTAGHPVEATTVAIVAPDTGETVDVQLGDALTSDDNLNQSIYGYGITTNADSAPGVLIANPDYLTGGGSISVAAGNSVLGRRDDWQAASVSLISHPPGWIGPVDEPWRSGAVGAQTSAAIDPQLFPQGIATLGGGDISVSAGANVSDMSVIATDSMVTAPVAGAARTTAALAAFGGGNVRISAGADILGGQVDVASGEGTVNAGHDIASAGSFNVNVVAASGAQPIENLLTLRLTDATVQVSANGSIDMQGVTSLGVRQQINQTQAQVSDGENAYGLYSPRAGVSLVANGDVTVANGPDNTLAGGSVGPAIYPGTFQAVSLTGDLLVNTLNTGLPTDGVASEVLLAPSPVGQLSLLAGGGIAPSTIAMLDADPGILPGPFSIFQEAGGNNLILSGVDWGFPGVMSSTSDTDLGLDHKQSLTHAGDSNPVRIAAGVDIGNDSAGLILSVPKQARIYAGQDIINMMFFGQNIGASDITRVAAGRDITATTALTAPVTNVNTFTHGAPEPALLGNTFVIGGPGSFILQAGRNAGPFLNSADVSQFIGSTKVVDQTYGGGVLSVGNDWNPWLPDQGASVSVLFGVAGGINYTGFREAYLDPANLDAMPDYLFEQKTSDITTGSLTTAVTTADRGKPIYGPMLVAWMQANNPIGLEAAYGTINVNYAQAYAVFAAMPVLNQQAFLNRVYFDELKDTSDPAGPSYLQYSRGYQAVNTLFPASYGYTQNDLTGGSNGANAPVETGNLDLRLASIQTDWGGDVAIMGPGGRVLAGSTVRTDQQAARRAFLGGALFNGGIPANGQYLPVAVESIPSGEEGVLTLRGGDISSFTDGDFLVNQSRVFTENGGDIIMWSSNADLNAGQGPKTSANFPPVVVRVSDDLFSQLDQAGSTTGAGIATLEAFPGAPPSNVYLIAPRGTVDAGAAGIRVSGDFFVAALAVANADNIQVQGKSFGLPPAPVTNLTLTTASTAATEAASIANNMRAAQPATTVEVEVTGFGGDFNQPDLCVPSAGNSCSPGSR
jgi:filamentous hemagglutinin family protein